MDFFFFHKNAKGRSSKKRKHISNFILWSTKGNLHHWFYKANKIWRLSTFINPITFPSAKYCPCFPQSALYFTKAPSSPPSFPWFSPFPSSQFPQFSSSVYAAPPFQCSRLLLLPACTLLYCIPFSSSCIAGSSPLAPPPWVSTSPPHLALN